MFMIVYVIVVGPSLKLKLQFHISSQSQTKSMLLDASYHARPHPNAAPADRGYRNAASRCAAPGPSVARGHSSPESCCTSPSRAANAARTHLK